MTEVIRSLKTYARPEDPKQNPFRLLPPSQTLKKVEVPEIVVEGVPLIPQAKPPMPRNET